MIPLKFYRDDEYVYYNNPNGITKKMNIADFEELFSEGGGSSDIPTYDSGDSGKVLTVNSGGTGLEWDEGTSDIPTYDSSDAGKILTVNSGGTDLEWDEGSSDVPTYDSSDAGKILTVNSGGTGLEWSEKGGVTSYPYVVDDVNQTEYFDITYQQALSHFNNGELFFLYGTVDTLEMNEFIYPVTVYSDGTNAIMRCLNSSISGGHLEYYDLVANELSNWKFQFP